MWVIFAILTSIINSFYDMGKQTIKLTPTIFILFRGYITAFIALPFLFLYPYPTHWQFYALCTLQGAIVAYNDLINYKATKKYGAEMVSAIQPLSTALLFFVWFFIAPSILQEYWANKTTFLLIILSIYNNATLVLLSVPIIYSFMIIFWYGTRRTQNTSWSFVT